MLEINQIYHGNHAILLPQIDDDTVDLTVTSPPYDLLRAYNGFTFDFENCARELFRVTKPGGVVVWIVGDQTTKEGETGTSFKQALFFKSLGFYLHDTMIYKKNAIPYPEVYRYYNCFEYMFVFSKGELKTFNAIQDRKNKHGGMKVSGTERKVDGSLKEKPCKKRGATIKEFGYRWNVWDYNVGLSNYEDSYLAAHPATFPMELVKDHIMSWSNPGDLVLDPMCGSGTTPAVSEHLDRNYIAMEISEEYYNLSKKRLTDGLYVENGITHIRNKLW